MPTHLDLLRRRFGSLGPTLSPLSPESVAELMAACRAALEGRGWAPVADVHAARVFGHALPEWLNEHVSHEGEVAAVWLGYREGFTVEWNDLVEHLHEVWFPGADDIWISDGAFGLFIDHEERFRVFRPT